MQQKRLKPSRTKIKQKKQQARLRPRRAKIKQKMQKARIRPRRTKIKHRKQQARLRACRAKIKQIMQEQTRIRGPRSNHLRSQTNHPSRQAIWQVLAPVQALQVQGAYQFRAPSNNKPYGWKSKSRHIYGEVQSSRMGSHVCQSKIRHRDGAKNETTHENKGCWTTKGADSSSSADGKWQRTSELMQKATKNGKKSDQNNFWKHDKRQRVPHKKGCTSTKH